MLIFIDESGDNGFKFGRGSSNCFLVTMVFIRVHDAADIDGHIKNCREDRNWSREFHFKENPDTIRHRFYEHTSRGNYFYRAILIEKQKVSPAFPRKKSDFYKKVVEILFEDDPTAFHLSKVIVDESSDVEFQKQLSKHLRQLAKKHQITIKDIKYKNWKGNSLLQVADMVSGAIYRKYDKNDSVYYDKIRKHENKILIVDT